MVTVEQINQWQDIVRKHNNQPIKYEELVSECAKVGLEQVCVFLLNNHYIGIMRDGNVFISWSKNNYFPEATIINLKAELQGVARKATVEERLEILEARVSELERKWS